MICIIFGGWYQGLVISIKFSDRRCLVDEQFGKCLVKFVTDNSFLKNSLFFLRTTLYLIFLSILSDLTVLWSLSKTHLS